MTSPRANYDAPNYQETEIVFINSSPANGVGLPAARVMKRKGDHYMRPRSPESPGFSRAARKVMPISASRVARFKSDFVQTKVSELQVARFQPLDSLNGRNYLPINIINLRRVPVFNPSDNHTSTFSHLMSLDMLPARGLLEVDFWKLFSKCGACSNFMTTRTIPYHECPTPGQSLASGPRLTVVLPIYVNNAHKIHFIPEIRAQLRDTIRKDQSESRYYLRFLDVHGIGGAAGVPESIFETIFYACGQCGRYMTERIKPDHHDDADLDDYTCINLAADRLEAPSFIVRKRVCAEFPSLEPLSESSA